MLKPLSSKKAAKASINSCEAAKIQHITPVISDFATDFFKNDEILSKLHQKWLDNGGASDGGSNRAFWVFIEIQEKVLEKLTGEQQRSPAAQAAFTRLNLDALIQMAVDAAIEANITPRAGESHAFVFTPRQPVISKHAPALEAKPGISNSPDKKKFNGPPIDWNLSIDEAHKLWENGHGKQYVWLLRDFDIWCEDFTIARDDAKDTLADVAGHALTEHGAAMIHNADFLLSRHFCFHHLADFKAGDVLPVSLAEQALVVLDSDPVSMADNTVGTIARALKKTPFDNGRFVI